ncbi:FAD-dependent monooxygenase [Amycolatopsis sp. NBC_01488]|uniref:FAD-dependent monooxygenase n=1 Tax=Amycolatopsis sp. NBC_01488 TaxID=2903563 RepID=UPI002E2BBD8F|nr:FAD-dependent monooxygenase [Amycolatopsis sp. NBC_01488]
MDIENADVIVVGAGPTGLLLAAELGLAGLRPVVADRLAARSPQTRALNLQPRSAEVLDARGLLEPLLARAGRIHGGHFGGIPVTLDYRRCETRHPYQVAISQTEVEAVLEDRLRDDVRRGWELTALESEGDGVTATFATPDGERRVRGRYLVGCDGAHSAVRRLGGFEFPGRTGMIPAATADVILLEGPPGLPRDLSDIAADDAMSDLVASAMRPRPGGGFTAVNPVSDGLYQIVFMGLPQFSIGLDAPVTEEEVRAALDDSFGTDVVFKEFLRGSRFTDSVRQAAHYRRGSLFLAGDAAHVHIPVGGQGLNLGLQDAFNLGWKLAAAVAGTAPDHLLDSYHAERHPVGARVLAGTRAQGLLMAQGILAAGPAELQPMQEDLIALRDVLVGLAAVPEANRTLAEEIAGLGVRHAADEAAHPLLGRRMPDLDVTGADGPGRVARLTERGEGLLIDFGSVPALGSAAEPWRDRVAHRVIRPVVPQDFAAALVRPDGHVCWLADSPESSAVDSLVGALRHWFGEPACVS